MACSVLVQTVETCCSLSASMKKCVINLGIMRDKLPFCLFSESQIIPI